MIWKRARIWLLVCVAALALPFLRLAPTQPLRSEYSQTIQDEGGIDTIHPEFSTYVARVGRQIAKVSDRPDLPYEFTVINTTETNAWAMGEGKIAIHSGLLMKLKSEAELASVLAHEIGHATAAHGPHHEMRANLFSLLKWAIPSGWTGVFEEVIQNAIARRDELEADRLSLIYMERAGYDVRAAQSVEEMYLALGNEESNGIFASHPSSQKRLEALKKLLPGYSEGGIRGEIQYGRAAAALLSKRGAYEALERGMQDYIQGDAKEALKVAREGLAIEGREPHLWMLEARSLIHLEKDLEALSAINRAIAINPSYYEYYLERSLIYELLGREGAAAADKTRADLLSTQSRPTLLGRST